MTNEITGRLENWYYDKFFHCIWGNIIDDVRGRFTDGTRIHTSHIVSFKRSDEKINSLIKGDIIETLNSTYELGEPKTEKNMGI